ncbi:MAG: restriction endonuclease [Chloroflexi bacterium]|nr:restriction endonuclease [Chloroflexota bacterium]
MVKLSTTVLPLQEYQPAFFAPEQLTQAAAQLLHQRYRAQVDLQPPSFLNQGRWQLTARGWVGFIALLDGIGLSLQPKVPLANLFGMLEVAYTLQSFRFLPGLFNAATLEEFYERLAQILAQQIVDRFRKGIYRAYVPQAAALPYVRGQLDLPRIMRKPWQADLPCRYDEQTADVPENQILTWTLHRILQSDLCTEQRALPRVRQAYRLLQQTTTLQAFTVQAATQRAYNRLNSDYHPLHALCHFFLDQSGPSHEVGARTMVPFVVDMARLYERFVAEWLKIHLGDTYTLQTQERYHIGNAGPHFEIDLVVYAKETGQVRWVMDTKYRAPEVMPSPDEVAQVVAYAEAKGADEAILIYPIPLARPLDQRIGQIRVRSLTFALDRDLDQAGITFLAALPVVNNETGT